MAVGTFSILAVRITTEASVSELAFGLRTGLDGSMRHETNFSLVFFDRRGE